MPKRRRHSKTTKATKNKRLKKVTETRSSEACNNLEQIPEPSEDNNNENRLYPNQTHNYDDESVKQPPAPRPKPSDLKIHPPNYVPKLPEEGSQPTTRFEQSDDDSDGEKNLEQRISEEQVRNLIGRYPLKMPPKKHCAVQ